MWSDLAIPTLAGCQLCQTLGGIYLTITIEDSMKKMDTVIAIELVQPTATFHIYVPYKGDIEGGWEGGR